MSSSPESLILLTETEAILNGNIAQRLPKLTQLRARVKKLNEYFIARLLEGLCDYYEAREMVQTYQASKNDNTSYDEEVEMREKVISLAVKTVYTLKASRDMSKNLDAPKEIRNKIESSIDWHIYLATNLDFRQRLIISMNDLNYSEAKKLAESGLELAKIQPGSQKSIMTNINFYAGNLKEIEAFERFCDKRFWEITTNDFMASSKLFDQSVEILERAATLNVDLDRLTSVSKAWSYLLRFIARPSLENLEYLAEYRKLEESFPTVRRQFSFEETRHVSRRKLRAARMSAFLRDSVYKIACWNVFNELHFNVNLVEGFINVPSNKELLRNIFSKTKMPIDRLNRYFELNEESKSHLTYEYFMDDIEKYLPDLLPLTAGPKNQPSLILAKNLYHLCKHQNIQADIYSPKREQFTELFVDKILKGYKVLKTLNLDRTRFLSSLEKENRSSATDK